MDYKDEIFNRPKKLRFEIENGSFPKMTKTKLINNKELLWALNLLLKNQLWNETIPNPTKIATTRNHKKWKKRSKSDHKWEIG